MEGKLTALKRLWLPNSRNSDSEPQHSMRIRKIEADFKQAHAIALQLAASPGCDLNLADSGYASSKSTTPEQDQLSHSGSNTKLDVTVKQDNGSTSTLLPPGAQPPKLSDIPRYSSQPLSPPIFGVTTPGGGLRLPPTIVARHMPLPIQDLPSLPTTTLPPPRYGNPSTPPVRRSSLRSIASLPRIGRDDGQSAAAMDPEMDDVEEEGDADDVEDEEEEQHTDPGVHRGHDDSDSSDSDSVVVLSNDNPMDPATKNGDHGVLLNASRHSESSVHTPNMVIPDTQIGNSDNISTPRPQFTSPSQDTAVSGDYFSSEALPSQAVVPTIITTAASPGGIGAASQHYDSVGSARQASRGHAYLTHSATYPSSQHPLYLAAPRQEDEFISPSPPSPSSSSSLRPRPSFYRQPSRSMANLYTPTPSISAKETSTFISENVQAAPLRRRTSMPFLNPPAYVPLPSDISLASLNGLSLSPRDEEGMEPLPSYELTIPLLAALLPRKMEFSEPGKQADDRKWRKVWCVLQGTSFKVYEGEKKWEKVEGWFGKRKDVEDRKSIQTLEGGKGRIRIKGVRSYELDDDDRPKYVVTRTAHPSPNSFSGSTLHPESADRASLSSSTSQYASSSRTSVSLSRRSSVDSSSNSHLSVPTPPHTHRRAISQAINSVRAPSSHRQTRSMDVCRPSSPMNVGSRAPSPSLDADTLSNPESMLHSTAQEIPDISFITSRPLIRHYTLQKAESGVAIDYHKRPNVMRIRLEGEQFLLQAKDVKQVVEWIEGFQAAADIALDLDERAMPRGPIFPRRRRRRRVRPADTTQEPSAHTNS